MKSRYWFRLLRSRFAGAGKGIERLDAVPTLQRIIDDNISLARFGDGELKLALYGRGLRFQRHSARLEQALNEALLARNDRVLRCVNGAFMDSPEVRWLARYQRYPKGNDSFLSLREPDDVMVFHRRRQQLETRRHWRIIESESAAGIYGAAGVFYLALYVDQYEAGSMDMVLDLFRALFNRRRILFVGPEQPVGGESFRAQLELMRSLGLRDASFITVPATDAFEHSAAIKQAILDSTGFDDVFLQAGPAATVWAYELAHRIDGRVLDVGSLNTQLRYLV